MGSVKMHLAMHANVATVSTGRREVVKAG